MLAPKLHLPFGERPSPIGEGEVPRFQSRLTEYAVLEEWWAAPNVLHLRVCINQHPHEFPEDAGPRLNRPPVRRSYDRADAKQPSREAVHLSRTIRLMLIGGSLLLAAVYFFVNATPIEEWSPAQSASPVPASESAADANTGRELQDPSRAERQSAARPQSQSSDDSRKELKKFLILYLLRSLRHPYSGAD